MLSSEGPRSAGGVPRAPIQVKMALLVMPRDGWTICLINKPSTVASIVNLVRTNDNPVHHAKN